MTNVQLLDRVARVRAFNRLYTGVIGALDEGLVGSPHSLSEARVLYELEQQGVTEVTELRRRLGMDAGYASRLLGKLEARGLLVREKSESDARRQVLRLTEAGRDEQHVLEQNTIDQVAKLLEPLTEEDQHRLLGSMQTIAGLVGDGAVSDPTVVLRPPRPGDWGWVVERHGARYAEEYGWGAEFEAWVARIVADYLSAADPKQAGWIAELDGERVGAIACTRGPDEETALLRLLLLEPRARGRGIGKRLVSECLDFARAAGYRGMELSTYSVLTAARGIYRRAGFELLKSEPVHHYGQDLTSEVWGMEW
ncbi:MarR family transcriptional regulator [Amycolatopsis acidicola]|uniref:MarR family transcriptional regulator n=1 Tax=Amycolatopsis acidicola TaxID=2596893 RepID=A0A5N0V9D7_9PSEU|nr:helix-turn-helix domain-containing GNAT family N-acetyltransferase [Amycolatopsis acidicola]KAA9161152.1 MarR family transcriptional regulator [Amycolatopsis acidicola]